MRTHKRALIVIALLALPACVEQQVAERQRQAVAPLKEKFCGMNEPQRMAYLRRRLATANASGGYVAGRYVDSTVVLSSELGAERYEWRKATGC